MKITYDEVREKYTYNPGTGIFTFNYRVSKTKNKGDDVGRVNNNGYFVTYHACKLYLLHRLAFLYMNGYFPENDIDHINRIRTDNRWSNLREVSKQCNAQNSKIRITNTTGIKGVYWNKSNKKWVVQIRVNYKSIFLGYHDSKLKAALARLEGEKRYGFENCDANSSARKYCLDHMENKS